MSFSITEYKFGKYRGLMVYHPGYKHHIDILPSHGALLARIELFGQEITEPIENAKQLEDDHWYRNFWLMPFQNRVADGKYRFQETDYQLEINETERENALHGFFDQLVLQDIKHEHTDDKVTVKIDLRYEGDIPGYPFPFDCTVTYDIEAAGILILGYEVSNTGKADMPFTWGWHPYFKLAGERRDWYLQTGRLLHQPLDGRNLPDGDMIPHSGKFDLNEPQYDHCFKFTEPPYETILKTEGQILTIRQDHNMPYLQVFTPDRDSVAIEPVSSSVDAFNNGEGLQIVKAGGSLKGKIEVIFQKDDVMNHLGKIADF